MCTKASSQLFSENTRTTCLPALAARPALPKAVSFYTFAPNGKFESAISLGQLSGHSNGEAKADCGNIDV